MKDHYNSLSSTPKVPPTTGIHINTTFTDGSQHSQYQWQGSPLGALCSKKLWFILQHLTHNPGGDREAETAINAELIARGDHTSAARWRAPH